MPSFSRRFKLTSSLILLGRALGVCLLALMGFAGQAKAAISFVQQNSSDPQSSPTTVTLAFTAAQTAGNLNVVVVGWNDATHTVSSVTDSKGNVYVLAVGPTVQSGTATQSIYYAKNIAAATAGSNSVTVTFNAATAFPDVRIAEYAGLDPANPLDVSVAAQGTSTSSSSGAVTTTNANDLLVAANLVQTGTTGAGANFTRRVITSPDSDILEDRIVTATGSYTGVAPVSPSGKWIMQMAAFRAAGSGGTTPSITSLNPTSGQVGTSVTITGTNFGSPQGTSTVTFNGTSAGTATSWNATTIVIPVPTGATTGNVIVTVGGVASNGVSFTVTGPPASVTATAGTPQSATINAAFATALQATVRDAANNLLSGVVVTFTAPTSGASGTFAGGVNTATTNSSGVATSAVFTANSIAGGPYNVVASVTGATSANFALTNKVGPAAKIAVTSGSGQGATINTAFAAPLVATVTDAGNNLVSGVVVTFTAPTSGASGTFAGAVTTATTNASGVATSAVFTANATAGGPYNVVASATGATSANFSLTNNVGPATKVVVTSGSGQSAPINTAFTAPLVATVTDAGNNPVSGVLVTFAAPTSGASGTFAGGVNTATTNASGIATSATFTANATSGGPYNVVASATGATSANFSLTNLGAPPAKVAVSSGSGQSAAINTAFTAPLVALVTDSGNNPVNGVVVTFTAPTSGPTGTFAGGVNTATTNASGIATSATFSANSIAGGPYTVVASVTGATSANFSLTNTVGPAAKVAVTSGSGQSATVNTAFTALLVATVTDAGNNPVSGVLVTFTAPTSGASGTFAGGVNTATTNSSGVATSAVFTANATSGGPYNVVASATGATSANFSLTNLAGPPATITVTSGTPQSATISTAFAAPLVVTVTDAGSNPVSGVLVTFAAPTSGASGTFASGVNTATTNASGIATSAVFTANATAGGPYTVTASVTGVTTSASFSLTNLPGAASIAFVQSNSATLQGAQTSVPVVYTLAQTAGDLNVVVVGWNDSTATISSVVDSKGNTYAVAVAPVVQTGTATQAIYYAKNIASATAGTNTVTVTFSVAANAPDIRIAEYSGLDQLNPLDVAVGAQGSSVSSSSGSITTTSPNDLLVGANLVQTLTTGPGAGFTSRGITSPDGDILEDEVVTVVGSYSATAPVNPSGLWIMQMAAFRAAGSGGTTPSITSLNPASGQVGTSVTITGTNFGSPQGTSTVTFNGTAAGTATSWNATTIVIPVPTGATTGNVIVTVGGVASNGVKFTITGPPASVTATAGTPQSATINTAFGTALQVTVRDASNNPVNAVTVTFAAPTSGASGTFAGGLNTAVTNASGVATSATFTANATAGGPYTVTASVAGVATPASFSLTNLSASPAKVAVTSGSGQSAVINTAFTAPLVATVTDSGNNPVSGVVVTFTPPASGASGTFAGGANTATTNASGVATSAVFTSNSVAGGPYNVVASATGATSANFSFTNTPGPASKVVVTSGSGQSAAISTAFAAPLVATVTDSGNNPVSGVTVTFAPPTSGASGTFAGGVNTTTTNASGVATSATFTANATAGGPYTVTASVAGVTTPANFSLTNLSTSASIALVQHTSKDAGTTSSSILAFPSNNTAGNFIAVVIRAGSSGQVFTVSDSHANIYKQAVLFNMTVDSNTIGIYYAENILGGANTITVSDTISGTLRFAILEYSGVTTANSLDATVVTQGTSATPSSGTLVTGLSGDLLLGEIATGDAETYTAATGYKIEEFVPAEPNSKLIAEDQIQVSVGSASAAATLGASDPWAAALAAFKSASGAPPPPISVSVSPTSASVGAGSGSQAFTATLQNDFQNRGVTWTLSGAGCSGTTCGTLTNVTTTTVTYNGPANVPSPATVTLTATSISDTTKTATATITVIPGTLSVSVSPKRAAVTLSILQTVQFTATVTNDPSNSGVTWSVDGNNGGTAASGTVSTAGLYTPGTLPGVHTITATSVANAAVSASSTAAVTDLAGVYMHHNDPQRTGQNLKEYALTTTSVSSAAFTQLFSCPTDGYVYAQPLWAANLTVNGANHNVVFIATEHDSVYAYDADSPSCVQLWKTSFLGTGVTTMPWTDIPNSTNDVYPEIGITSTPVIDPTTNTIYVEAKTKETVGTGCSTGSPCYVHRLHALNILTGAEKFGGPVVISASGFNSQRHFNRPALLLLNGMVYIAFGSHGDNCNWQGWIFGYNAATLAQNWFWSTTSPSGCGGGAFWGGGAGPAADASGNLYLSTGNGNYDGTSNFGDTTVKLSPTGALLDWFTPFNQSTFQSNDVDLGSAGVIVLPDSVGSTAHQHLAMSTGKVAILYLLDQTNMGKFNSSSNNDVQEVIPVPPPNTTQFDGGNYSIPAYWNGNIYTTGQNFPLSQFHIANGAMATPQFAESANIFPPRGGVPAVSASGTTNGVVWVIDYTAWQPTPASGPAILDAYDATNVGTLLYSSPTSGTAAAGPAVKFAVATVANGKVYVGSQSQVTVFGLLPN
jgi:hypothetical protein